MTFKTLLALGLSAVSAFAGGAGWSPNFADSKKQAASEKKDLLVDFTGSDWCSWCIKLNKEVFDHDEFREGVKNSFVLVELDYPNDKSRLTPEILKQNDELKTVYPIKGFPTILLCDADGKPYAATGYQPDGPVKYVEQLNKLRGQKAARDNAFAKAAETKGVERAKQLVSALEALGLDDDMLRQSYGTQLDEIKTADPGDETGFAKKMESSRLVSEFNTKLGEFRQKGDQDGAMAFMDELLAKKDLPLALVQHIHGHKAGSLMYAQKPAEAAKVLEAGIAAGPDTDIGKELKGFLVLVNKQLDKAAAAAPEGAAPAKTEGQGKPAAETTPAPAK